MGSPLNFTGGAIFLCVGKLILKGWRFGGSQELLKTETLDILNLLFRFQTYSPRMVVKDGEESMAKSVNKSSTETNPKLMLPGCSLNLATIVRFVGLFHLFPGRKLKNLLIAGVI